MERFGTKILPGKIRERLAQFSVDNFIPSWVSEDYPDWKKLAQFPWLRCISHNIKLDVLGSDGKKGFVNYFSKTSFLFQYEQRKLKWLTKFLKFVDDVRGKMQSQEMRYELNAICGDLGNFQKEKIVHYFY